MNVRARRFNRRESTKFRIETNGRRSVFRDPPQHSDSRDDRSAPGRRKSNRIVQLPGSPVPSNWCPVFLHVLAHSLTGAGVASDFGFEKVRSRRMNAMCGGRDAPHNPAVPARARSVPARYATPAPLRSLVGPRAATARVSSCASRAPWHAPSPLGVLQPIMRHAVPLSTPRSPSLYNCTT
jgi:hypothetical protein